ncbi:hypothetical protein FHX35_002171 [Auritidibacter ignavus]|nr:hypothetical protein [Auritidibacter ignavus]
MICNLYHILPTTKLFITDHLGEGKTRHVVARS